MDYSSLVQTALKARKKAYAPYSSFYVGAALLCSNERVYEGANIENSAFTPSNCAERTAFFTAIYNEGAPSGETPIFTAIAVVGGKKELDYPAEFCPPCGVCLQVMAEFCDLDSFDVILIRFEENGELKTRVRKLREFLPFGFNLK